MTQPALTLPDPCGPVLRCPVCQGDYLHQGRVEVFERPREDASEGLHVSIHGMQVQITTDLDDNPSARRQGLRVYFSCEGCCACPVLNIAQHKGNTFMNWENRHGSVACAPDCDRYPASVRRAGPHYEVKEC